MAAPAPLNSLLGGITLPIPVHTLLLLNGSPFGVSGFVHRAVRGSFEALAPVLGLIISGIVASLLGGGELQYPAFSLPQIILSGFLVGFGTKLSNGCTSGHMVCGVARLSVRSIVATMLFFITGVITAYIAHVDLPPTAPLDWSLGSPALRLLSAQLTPFAVSILLYLSVLSNSSQKPVKPEPNSETPLKGTPVQLAPLPLSRYLAFLSTSVQFGFAIELSGLTSPDRVIRFLLLPFHRAFDPSLAFLAVGAIPLAMVLYHYARGNEVPHLGGNWTVPKGGEIDWKLMTGAAIFGVGWGLAGVCPGPGLVNLGRALVYNNEGQLPFTATWLAAMVVGGLVV